MTVNPQQPIAVSNGLEGRTFDLGDHTGLCLVSSATTGGAFALIEVDCDPDGGTPPHIHHNEDETFYILTGRFEIQIEEQIIEADPGDCVFAPRGRVHCWRNIGGSQGRFLVTLSPGGLENFFMEMGEVGGAPNPADPAAMEKLMALAMRYGLELAELPSLK